MIERLELLNAPTKQERLENLRAMIADEKQPPSPKPEYANNHIHTTYSFSPYSPSAAVYFARAVGLQTAGIMDHDTICGADEFRKAAEIAGVAVTCGAECRVSLRGTPLDGRKVNNPDQNGIAYMAVHSVMPDGYALFEQVLAPLRKHRNARNMAMTERINALASPLGIELDFERDVLGCSLYHQGGSVTERHLMWALAGRVMELRDPARAMSKLGVTKKINPASPSLQYDLLGAFKAELIGQVYIPATDECMTLNELVEISAKVGAILCYPYLGDVGESITGDKRRQQFEDSYLDELFEFLDGVGVRGVTYMPSRNTPAQLERIVRLCQRYDMTQVCGEDINSPGQDFICEKLREPGFSHLVDTTWKLVERERGAK